MGIIHRNINNKYNNKVTSVEIGPRLTAWESTKAFLEGGSAAFPSEDAPRFELILTGPKPIMIDYHNGCYHDKLWWGCER